MKNKEVLTNKEVITNNEINKPKSVTGSFQKLKVDLEDLDQKTALKTKIVWSIITAIFFFLISWIIQKINSGNTWVNAIGIVVFLIATRGEVIAID